MERLTIKDSNKALYEPWELCGRDGYCKKVCYSEGGCTKKCHILKTYLRLSKYEELEKQGKLLKLPCKIGDPIYWVNNWFAGNATGLTDREWHITKSKVSKFLYEESELFIEMKDVIDISVSELNKSVFLTPEAAEVALKKMKNNSFKKGKI